MAVTSIHAVASSAFTDVVDRLRANAEEIATARLNNEDPNSTADLTPPQQVEQIDETARRAAATRERPLDEILIENRQLTVQARALAEVIKTADEMLGTLIDRRC